VRQHVNPLRAEFQVRGLVCIGGDDGRQGETYLAQARTGIQQAMILQRVNPCCVAALCGLRNLPLGWYTFWSTLPSSVVYCCEQWP
jgi:hypothetical protein